jgi:uncharacterized protein
MKPMDLKTRLSDDLKAAMRANDDLRRSTLRMALAAVKQAEVDRRTSLDEAGVIAILQKEIKSRRESLEEARSAGRADLAAAAEAEIAVLAAFLPAGLSPEELLALARQAVAEAGAASPADMGKVMKILMPRLAGRASGDQASQAVRQLLQE